MTAAEPLTTMLEPKAEVTTVHESREREEGIQEAFYLSTGVKTESWEDNRQVQVMRPGMAEWSIGFCMWAVIFEIRLPSVVETKARRSSIGTFHGTPQRRRATFPEYRLATPGPQYPRERRKQGSGVRE